jgi:hypothetical protein
MQCLFALVHGGRKPFAPGAFWRIKDTSEGKGGAIGNTQRYGRQTMTMWGYIRLHPDYASQLGSYMLELQNNKVAPVDNIRTEFSRPDLGKRHNRHVFNTLLKKEVSQGDTIVVLKLSHLSMEMRWIAQLVTRIAAKKLDFVALYSGVDTRNDPSHYFFQGMAQIAQLPQAMAILGGDGGGDGGGNGGC